MANTIDTSFIKQFEKEVHLAYQRNGAKLLNTVRKKMVKGESTTFQKIAAGVASTKTRNGAVSYNDLAHSTVLCTLADYYSAEMIDKLDELKLQHDERGAAATSLSAALGRKSDDLIISAVSDSGTINATSATGGLTKAKVEEVFEQFGTDDVPDDGNRVLVVSPQGWTDLMGITEFASRDYLPESELPFKGAGMSSKRWMGFLVMTHSGLDVAAGVRSSLAFHSSAVGLGVGQDVSMDVTWQGKEQAHLLVASMSQGAAVIDDNGCYIVKHTEV